MLARQSDPIVAIATAPGRGAVGIVRISGPDVRPLVQALCGRALRPREATYLPLRDAQGQPIDHGLALHFPAPNSYTGEDVLELQAHGGTVVLQLLLARCLQAGAEIDPATGQPRLPGLRVAQPGEFTQRAFLNDKIDLAQAEAIAGQPNAGKSSLLNALAGAELAIVTPIAGTTRDKVEQTIQIEGVPIHVIDTAGLRDSHDEVERIGIERAWGEIAAADAVLFLHDLTRAAQADYQAADQAIADTLARTLAARVPVLHVWNKLDQAAGSADQAPPGLRLSARTGQGLDLVRQQLLQVAGWQSAPEGVYIARERHVQALLRVQDHLDQAQACLGAQAQALDLLAEELRLAQGALNEITGEFTPDDLLGVIFSKFCIGK